MTELGLEAAQSGADWIDPALFDQRVQGGALPPCRGVLGLHAVLHCLTQARLAVAPLADATESAWALGLPKLRCVLAMAVRIADGIR